MASRTTEFFRPNAQGDGDGDRLTLIQAIARIFQRADDDLSRDPARVHRARLTRGFTSYVEHESVKSVGRRLRALGLEKSR